jgi:hypothetical protein
VTALSGQDFRSAKNKTSLPPAAPNWLRFAKRGRRPTHGNGLRFAKKPRQAAPAAPNWVRSAKTEPHPTSAIWLRFAKSHDTSPHPKLGSFGKNPQADFTTCTTLRSNLMRLTNAVMANG